MNAPLSTPTKIGVETLGDGCDGTVDLVGGDHHLEGFIVQRYGFLHIVFAVFGSVSVSMKIPSKGSAFCGIIPNLARETLRRGSGCAAAARSEVGIQAVGVVSTAEP